MSDEGPQPQHSASSGDPAPESAARLTGSRRIALIAGVAVVVLAAAVGVSLAVTSDSGSAANHPDSRSTTTERPTTTAAPTTTVPTTTSTAPPETTTTLPPTTTTVPPDPAADGTLELGEGGDAVMALQQRLHDLGYWMGEPDGRYGQLTRQAVMAFQKYEGLGRDGVAGPATQERLAVANRPTARGGGGLEIDLDRQVLLVVAGGGQVQWVLNTSTGSGEAYDSPSGGTGIARTPTGQFAIQREVDGVREAPLGTLYRPKYFTGGIAIHGSGSIPAHPASHGCARVTNSAMDMLWSSGAAALGTPVWVY